MEAQRTSRGGGGGACRRYNDHEQRVSEANLAWGRRVPPVQRSRATSERSEPRVGVGPRRLCRRGGGGACRRYNDHEQRVSEANLAWGWGPDGFAGGAGAARAAPVYWYHRGRSRRGTCT